MCPALAKRIKLLASQKRIIYKPTNSFYQVLSAEAYSKHGFNIHGVIFDELHTQPNRELFDVMTKGSGDARTQPLYFLITTAGNDTHSIYYETHRKAKDILEGRKIDPTFYPVIYGAEESDNWTDPEVWKKVNPSLGMTVRLDKVKVACESAKQNPAEENSFRQLRLNQWVKQAVRQEQSIHRLLLSDSEKKDYFVKFNVAWLFRGDYQSRMNDYATARQNSWMCMT